VNDMSEISIDAALIRNGEAQLSRTEEKLVELSNGCICCTLREDLLLEVRRLADMNQFDYLLIESTGIAEPMPVAETFTFDFEDGSTLAAISRLDTMVTVVDAPNFWRDYESMTQLRERDMASTPDDERTLTDLLVEQVEFADVLIINKTDLVTETVLNQLIHFLHRLNPTAKILPTTFGKIAPQEILNTGRFDFEAAAQFNSWLKESRYVIAPETEEFGISDFVYRAERPFHPARLAQFFEHTWHGLLRSKGFFWLATHYDQLGLWSQAGDQVNLSFIGAWPDEEVARQELVFIGLSLPHDSLTESLNNCLLTDTEMAAGKKRWRKFRHPLPI